MSTMSTTTTLLSILFLLFGYCLFLFFKKKSFGIRTKIKLFYINLISNISILKQNLFSLKKRFYDGLSPESLMAIIERKEIRFFSNLKKQNISSHKLNFLLLLI